MKEHRELLRRRELRLARLSVEDVCALLDTAYPEIPAQSPSGADAISTQMMGGDEYDDDADDEDRSSQALMEPSGATRGKKILRELRELQPCVRHIIIIPTAEELGLRSASRDASTAVRDADRQVAQWAQVHFDPEATQIDDAGHESGDSSGSGGGVEAAMREVGARANTIALPLRLAVARLTLQLELDLMLRPCAVAEQRILEVRTQPTCLPVTALACKLT